MNPIAFIMEGGLKALLKRLPSWVYIALAVAALLGIAAFLHHRAVKRAHDAAYAQGVQDTKAADAAAAAKLRAQVATSTAKQAAISQDTRSKNDAQVGYIHGSADAIRLRGPGAAGCGRVADPAVPAGGGQHGAASDKLSDASGNPVPSGNGQPNLIAVPFDWLVGRAEQADLDRSEVLSWRDWYARQVAERERLRTGLEQQNPQEQPKP